MIRTDLPFAEAEFTFLRIGPVELQLQLPIYGYTPTTLHHTSIDLDCLEQLPQRDAEGNRYTDILHQDWTYRYIHREALAGSIFLSISVHAKDHSGDFSNIHDLSSHLIEQVKKSEDFAQNLKRENAEWTGEAYDPSPCYHFPKSANEFSSESLCGRSLFTARIGGVGIDILPFDYYLPLRSDAYLCFRLTPSGFDPEDFTSQQTRDDFLRTLTDDFMHRIKITTDHPVSA